MEKKFVFTQKVKMFCRQKELFSPGDKVVIGLSGGADSVCLFLLLTGLAKEYELSLFPVHVNHNLRGAEALADQRFCEDLCRQYGLELTVVSVPVAELAKEKGWTPEEAGRNARYEAFAEIAAKYGCNKTAVAHHKDDQAETMLFQMFRGSRLKGLAGMEAKNGSLVRPLLCVTREEIENYLREKNQTYCIDRTNLEEEYTRNKIRHGILPMAEKICGGAVEHMAGLAEHAGQVEKLLERLTEELFEACVSVDEDNNVLLEIEALKSAEEILAERVVYKALCLACGRKKDITAGFVTDCMALVNKQTGRQISLQSGVIAERRFDRLFIGRKKEEKYFFAEVTGFPFETLLPETGKKLVLSVKKREELEENIPKSTYTKWFDYDKIEEVISVRTPAAEDEIAVYADGRKKKAADVFAEAKIPKEQRKNFPVLAEGNKVLWIPGIRGSEGYRITKETGNILIAELYGGNENGR